MFETENVGSTRRDLADICLKAAIVGGHVATQVLQRVYLAAHASVLKILDKVVFG